MTKAQLEGKLSDLIALTRTIRSQTRLQEWHTRILSYLCTTAAQSCYHVTRAIQAGAIERIVNFSYVCWAVRTLYEAKVWIRYCVSEDNAKRLGMAGVNDVEELLDIINLQLSESPDIAVDFDQVKKAREAM